MWPKISKIFSKNTLLFSYDDGLLSSNSKRLQPDSFNLKTLVTCLVCLSLWGCVTTESVGGRLRPASLSGIIKREEIGNEKKKLKRPQYGSKTMTFYDQNNSFIR